MDRQDLAAMVVPLGRTLLALESPVLAEASLTMWGYIVLTRLTHGSVRGQSVLAEAIRADKTRIIDVLDDLQDRGLIERTADPGDRRTRVLAITTSGRRLQQRVQLAIRREEDRLLSGLPAADRDAFLRTLQHLTAG